MATWTTYTGVDLTVSGSGFFGSDGLPGQTTADGTRSSSTIQYYTNPDGTFTILHGTGFSRGGTGNLSWTSLTSVDHVAANGTTLIEQITGIDPSITGEGGHFFSDILGGNDTLIGSAGTNELWGGEGNNTFTLGTGASIYTGGHGQDLFIIGAGDWVPSVIVNGNLVRGTLVSGSASGTGVTGNTVELDNAGTVDFRNGAINAIQTLKFASGTSTAIAEDLADNGLTTIIGSNGVDSLIIGAGSRGNNNSTLTFTNWTAGVDTITILGPGTGTNQNDIFDLPNNSGQGGGNVQAGAGDDTIIMNSNTGSVGIDGGTGNNTVKLRGITVDESGNNTPTITNVQHLVYDSGNSTIRLGNDELGTGAAQISTIAGSSGTDGLIINEFAASFDLSQISFTNWTDGTDSITVSPVSATNQGMVLTGSAHADTLIGSSGNDTLTGGAGDDTLIGGPGNNTLDGGTGNNTASYASELTNGGLQPWGQPVTVDLSISGPQSTGVVNSSDTLINIQNLIGGGGGDTLSGDANANILSGAAGDDVLDGRGGNDTLDGGQGTDTATYADAPSGVTVSLAITGPQDTVGAGTDTLISIENLIGSAFNDTLTGDGNDNALTGGAGDDTLIGGAGNDTLTGNGGHDLLTGGAGSDKFIIDAGSLSEAQAATPVFDHITDFDHGNTGLYSSAEGDQISVSAIVLAALAGGQQPTDLVRIVEDSSNTHSLVQVDSDGTANGIHWTTIAQLDGIHLGDSVNVIVNQFAPTGLAFSVLANDGHFGDFDGDGSTDVIWRNDDGSLAVWQMNGGTPTAHFLQGVPNDWHILGVGDFNGDTKSDVLWQNDDGSLLDWQMASSSSVGSTPGLGTTPANNSLAGIGDFNGDHKDDLLWRDNSTGALTVQITSGASNTLNLGTDWSVVGTGDFNGDGTTDIMFRNAGQGINAAWLMSGTSVSNTVFYPGVPNDWHVVATGDFNGDGITDLFWHNDNGANAVWLLKNTGDIQQAAFFTGVSSDWHVIGSGDLDGRTSNGHPIDDVMWRADDGSTAIWEMNGASAPNVVFPGGVPTDWATQAHHYDYV